ncbi:MAG TPA: hypothetical protein VII75_04955 [Thermoanaerobaculia bacterium]
MSSKAKLEAKVDNELPIDPLTGHPFTPEEWTKRMRFAQKTMALKGKIHLDLDIDEIRGRNRR